MTLRVSFFHSLLVAAIVCQGYTPASADDASDGRNMLRRIAREQQKNLDKLPPLKWSSVSSVKLLVPGKERESINERVNIRSGDLGWGKNTLRWQGSGPQQASTRVVVWNDRYVAQFHTITPKADMWEFDAPASIPEAARLTRAGAGAYPERVCAFGHSGKTLREMLQEDGFSSKPVKVSREGEGAEDLRYRVELFHPDHPYPYPSIEWSVDPNRGYMIVAGIHRHEALGYKQKEFTVSGREVAPGVWFPTQWRRISYGEPDPVTGEQAVVRTDDFDITEMEVLSDIPDSQFEWPALELKPSTEVWRFDASGEMTRMRAVNGELVSVSPAINNSK